MEVLLESISVVTEDRRDNDYGQHQKRNRQSGMHGFSLERAAPAQVDAGRSQDCPTLLGLAILVERTEQRHRDLVLEFDIDPGKHGDMPQHQRFRITDSRLAEAVAAAMKAGWDPESRGRHFVHEAGELQRR